MTGVFMREEALKSELTEATMSSGTHKPPVAPKPKLTTSQKAALSPQVPRKDGLSVLSPGMPRKFKPPVAPKPCHSKPNAAVETKLPISKSLQHNSISEIGLFNSQNGIQQIKNPEWDYIIPICLCSQENCTCTKAKNSEPKEKNFRTSHNKTEENGKTVPLSSGKQNNGRGYQVTNYSTTNAHDDKYELHYEKLNVGKRLRVDSGATSPQEAVGPSRPHRTRSNETNPDAILQGVTGGRQENDGFGPEQTGVLQHKPSPGPFRKAPPVPVPRKPRAAATSLQETAEREETTIQQQREITVKEVKVSSDKRGSSSASVSEPDSENNRPIYLSARKAWPLPAVPPKTKPFLSDTTKTPTSSAQTPSEDMQVDDLASDTKPYEVEKSVYKKDKEMWKKVADNREETHHLPKSTLMSRPEVIMTAAAEEIGVVKASRKKPRRHSSTLQPKKSFEEKEVDQLEDREARRSHDLHNDAMKKLMSRELPVPPIEKPARNVKPSGSSLSKKKAKSFSSADVLQPEGQKGNGFRKVLELKLAKKTVPKKMGKKDQNPYSSSSDLEGSAHKDEDVYQRIPVHPGLEHKLSSSLAGVEQSVDGDDFSSGLGEDGLYDNIPIYEEISDYENVLVGKSSPLAANTAGTPGSLYKDEGIYEAQEPYFSLVKSPQQDHTPTEHNRNLFDEDVAALNDTFSDDDQAVDTSDEEDENEYGSTSTSSKDDHEQRDEAAKQREKNNSKIQYIASEIMSSESVFVDVLKMLHVDFRASVEKASQRNGKPVIEERLLSQILYDLPQLYELNEDLLRELKQRVAHWDENSQIADIFLKKGPYLKMYSTYIREFDKNVALLEEQIKKNSAFGAVVKEFEASPRCANLRLKHYLLKPVQRIPQYQLLLTDYLKNLTEDSYDYKDTQAALALVKEVANHANDIIKHGDNFEKLIRVQSHLSGHHQEIVQPGRILLKEGALMKLSRKVMQPRMFFLFNDTLLYTIPVQSGQYKLKNMLSLAGMKVSKPSQEAYQNELNIESVERSFILSANSASERDEWLEMISSAISEYTKKKISFISGKTEDEELLRNDDDGAPLGSKAPIWIPDLRTTMCMICTCDFTLTWRRHHCRACGKVVCQACSSNKCSLAYKKNQLSRVCDQCFTTFQKQKSAMVSLAAVTPGSKATFGFRKHKKIPAALKEVSANTDNSSMSGYLMRSNQIKKQGKRLWFVIKDKVLYTYAASEDVAALESQPLLGFVLKVDPLQKQQFKLYHKDKLYYIYKADNVQTAQRWIKTIKEATVL